MTAAPGSPAISPLHAYRLICRWQLIQLKEVLPFIVFAQVVFATGGAIGLGFLIPHIDPRSASYLASGSFLLSLLLVGIVIVPSAATEARTLGTLDYMWSLPVPRLTYLVADLTIWFLAVLPGLIVSLVATSLRFDFDLRLSPMLVPAVAMALFTAAAVGYAVALRSTSNQVTNLFSNLVLVLIFLFSPLNFPIDRLPGWLQAVHAVLPIAPMADLMRGSLIAGTRPRIAHDFLVLGLWCAFGVFATLRMVARRR